MSVIENYRIVDEKVRKACERAGRKPEDEEIHLNSFDRWYTEIAAGIVIGVWLVGVMGMVTVISLVVFLL